MQHCKVLRTIPVILGFAVVSLCLLAGSCATAKNQTANSVIPIKAEAVPEGIRLTFDSIPPEAHRIFIHFQYFVREEAPGITNLVSSFSDLRGDSLTLVKQTGNVIFPVVEEGRKYNISVIFQGDDFEDIADWLHVDCTAKKGTHLTNNVSLSLNEAHSAVTLSTEPVFSSEVTYDETKYNFDVTIHYHQTETETGSIGVGSHHVSGIEGLTWTFDPEMSNHLRAGGYLESGSYPAYVTARCNIIYENIQWSVEIAKTGEFTYSL